MATFGSLFSGVGGLDLGLERAGWECKWQVEIDEWRRGVLERHWPGVPRYADVREVGGDLGDSEPSAGSGRIDLCPVNLICGGFPCQDVSVAGRRAGLAGARSGLFHEFARIADAVRPGLLLIENVPGLLTSNRGRDFGVVLGTLADLGYGVAWRILDSRFFGVPQRRRRVFIVGALPGGRAGAERAGEVLAVGTRCDRHPAKGAAARPGVAGTPGANAEGGGWSPEPGEGVVGRTLKAGGNDRGAADHMTYVATYVKAQKAHDPDDIERWEEAALAPALDEGGHGPRTATAVVSHSLTSEGHDASEDGTGRGTPLVTHALTAARGRAATEDGTGRGAPLTPVLGSGVRRLTPVECCRLQSFPDDWLGEPNEPPDSPRYAAMGDAVTVNVAEWLGTRLKERA